MSTSLLRVSKELCIALRPVGLVTGLCTFFSNASCPLHLEDGQAQSQQRKHWLQTGTFDFEFPQ